MTTPGFEPQLELTELLDVQVLIAEIDGFAMALNGCYSQMSEPARLYALEVGHTLSKLKARLESATGAGIGSPGLPSGNR